MITIISCIKSEQDLKVLNKNLVRFEPDLKIGLNILCCVTNEKLFLECRNWCQENFSGKSLTIFEPDKNLIDLLEYKNNDNDFVFFLGDDTVISYGGLGKLYKLFLDRPMAGFATGLYKGIPTPYWVKNIYEDPGFIYFDDSKPLELIMNVDIAPLSGVLMKTNIAKEIFAQKETFSNEYDFGIELRKKGFNNYIDTSVLLEGGYK